MIIRLLQKNDERGDFSCGDAECDTYLRQFAGQNQFRHRIGTTLVAVEDEVVLGYASFSAGEISRSDMPEDAAHRFPRYPLPVLRLTRLAVDERYRGLGIGTELVAHVLLAAFRLRDDFGCVGVLVDALPETAEFYQALGFEQVATPARSMWSSRTVQMLLPLRYVEDAASR